MKFFAFISLLIIGIVQDAWSIDEGEKLTVRFLKVSSSKKTVLVNRGSEDGIKVGEHAKFFLTAGVVSRGVVEKVAPTRSIWSIYRLVDPNDIFEGKVVDILKASEAKITEDHTRSLSVEHTQSGVETMGIPVAEGGNDLPKEDLNSSEQKDLDSLETGAGSIPVDQTLMASKREGLLLNLDTSDGSKAQGRGMNSITSWEIAALMTWSNFSVSTETDVDGSEAQNSSTSNFSFASSIEKYFPHNTGFWRSMSLLTFYEYLSTTETYDSSTSSTNLDVSSKQHNLGAGLHFHIQDPFLYEKMIFFLSGKFGLISTSSTLGESSSSGSGLFGAIGAGIKFYSYSNFGMRFLFDYYFQQTQSEASTTGTITTTAMSGPKLYVGLSYRW